MPRHPDDQRTSIEVNGEVIASESADETALLYVLRDEFGLTGTRFGCGEGECGACMVLVDDVAIRSCDTPLWSVAGKTIETVEGLASDGGSSVQRALIDHQAGQCGYCLSGMVVAAEALLRSEPSPAEETIRAALDRNLCRCGSHLRILAAIRSVAQTKSDALQAKR